MFAQEISECRLSHPRPWGQQMSMIRPAAWAMALLVLPVIAAAEPVASGTAGGEFTAVIGFATSLDAHHAERDKPHEQLAAHVTYVVRPRDCVSATVRTGFVGLGGYSRGVTTAGGAGAGREWFGAGQLGAGVSVRPARWFQTLRIAAGASVSAVRYLTTSSADGSFPWTGRYGVFISASAFYETHPRLGLDITFHSLFNANSAPDDRALDLLAVGIGVAF